MLTRTIRTLKQARAEVQSDYFVAISIFVTISIRVLGRSEGREETAVAGSRCRSVDCHSKSTPPSPLHSSIRTAHVKVVGDLARNHQSRISADEAARRSSMVGGQPLDAAGNSGFFDSAGNYKQYKAKDS